MDWRITSALSISRFLRSFVLMLLSVSSPYFLIHLHLNYVQTGVVLFLSMSASTAAIYFYPKVKINARKTVILYSFVFTIVIIIVLIWQNLIAFLIAIIVGGISLSGKDMTPNHPIEQYAIGVSFSDQREKNRAFAFYNFMAYFGNMAGALFLFFGSERDFHLIFEVSAIIMSVSIIPYLFIKLQDPVKPGTRVPLDPETKKLTHVLAALFATDSFGGGFVNASLLSLWFYAFYNTSLQVNGMIFFIVSLITAISIIYSGSLSTRLGLVRTMVYTHLISNVFLILMPVFHSLIYSEVFLFLRQSTSQMDVSPRDSLINTIIDPKSRIRTNSIFLASRNLATVPTPAIGGILIDLFPPSLLYAAGTIKATYDFVFYVKFRKYRI